MTDDAILSQVTDQPDITTTETDNEDSAEPMPTKSEVDSAFALVLHTTEGTQGITKKDLEHFNALKCSIFK